MLQERKYPRKLYRGVTSRDFVSKDGSAMAGAFQFAPYDSSVRTSDTYCELSINWGDDVGALPHLLNQCKPFHTEFQFKVGYCVLDRLGLELIFRQYIELGYFSYERKPIEGVSPGGVQPNPYHGNLLMLNTIENGLKRNIQHTLATLAGRVIQRESH